MWKKRGSRKPIDCPTVRYFTERFFFLPITEVPERHHRINARFLFYQELPIAFICWQHPLESFLLAPASFATSATKIIRWFNLSHRIAKNLPIQQHGDMMYTAVLYLFYLPKQEPYFILKAHQVKKQHRTLFQQQYFSSPFFDLCKISTLQPQTLQPDRSVALWECMWIIAHKKNCI